LDSRSSEVSPRLVVISGPIASGKTVVSEALGAACRERGLAAAVIDLDVVYEMLDHRYPWADPAVWQRARRLQGGMAAASFACGIEVVVLEGAFWTEVERGELSEQLPRGIEPQFVTLRVSFPEALRRVSGDPSRRLSRDHGFLAEAHAKFNALPLVSSDLMLDSEAEDASTLARVILEHLRS
jgi:predicted kinase